MSPDRIGVTGHRWNKIGREFEADLKATLRRSLAELDAGDAATLVCGMAEGTDLCAASVRPLGWRLEAVLPLDVDTWRRHLAAVADRDADLFSQLVTEASLVRVLGDASERYSAIAEHIAATCDRLVAVWDGRPGAQGGTADVIARCRARGMPVLILPVPGASEVS